MTTIHCIKITKTELYVSVRKENSTFPDKARYTSHGHFWESVKAIKVLGWDKLKILFRKINAFSVPTAVCFGAVSLQKLPGPEITYGSALSRILPNDYAVS